MLPLAYFSNLAGPDGFLIMFFVLIFFGAKRLPELARSMGSAMKEFNKVKDDFTRELNSPAPAQVIVPPDVVPLVTAGEPKAPQPQAKSDVRPQETSSAGAG